MASLLNLSGSALMNKFTPQRDYSLEYFTIESLADSNTVSIKNVNCNRLPTFYYSTDNGTTWSSITAEKGKTKSVATINTGGKMLFKCNINSLGTSYSAYNCFLASKNHVVYGNAMSLLYGDNFASNSEFASNTSYNLAALFRDNTTLTDASNLILTATTATAGCYNGMFRGCTNLIKGVKVLPATSVTDNMYASMFEGCVNMEEAPEMYCTTIAGSKKDAAFKNMFCMSRTGTVTARMTRTPVLRIDNISGTNSSYPVFEGMFMGNGSLTEVTCLATTVGSGECKNWLLNVSPTGTFKKAASMTSWPSGTSGIPSGWTVEDYTE